MSKSVLVSLLLVNYKGRHLLKECLDSIFALSFPTHQFEVILVDNNSQDGSVRFVSKHYPQVRIIESKSNLGFTGGNNLAYESAKGKYIVLLNTDTTVEKNWLNALVLRAQEKNVGIVSSLAYFSVPFLRFSLESAVVSRSEVNDNLDFTPLGVMVEENICDNSNLNELVLFGDGFYDKSEGEVSVRWTRDKAEILVPFDFTDRNKSRNKYKFTIHSSQRRKFSTSRFSLKLGKKQLVEAELIPSEVRQYQFDFSYAEVKNSLIWLVQNAGNAVFQDGYSRDRGAVIVRKGSEVREFYEEISDFYKQPSKVLAFCGCGTLIKREVIEKLGFFDGNYFMYYEDIDLSLRAWKGGWDLVYEATAVLYHKHRGSTGKAESGFFLRLVERNHLFLLLTHFPLTMCVQEYFFLTNRALLTNIRFFLAFLKNTAEVYDLWKERKNARNIAWWDVTRSLPRLFANRLQQRKFAKRKYQEMKEYLY